MLAVSNEHINFVQGQIYNTSHHASVPKTAKSSHTSGGVIINNSRNAKISSSTAVVKSNSEIAGQAPANTTSETSQAYKSSGHVSSVTGQVG